MEHPNEPGPPEKAETLWMIPSAPTVWALHFLASYGTVAVWCAKVGGSLALARWLIAGYTVAAVALIAVIAVWGWRRHSYGKATAPHDYPSAADRHRFLGFATLLLAGLSLVGTLFVALSAVFIGSCQ